MKNCTVPIKTQAELTEEQLIKEMKNLQQKIEEKERYEMILRISRYSVRNPQSAIKIIPIVAY